jgi:hypothetical protein
MWSADILSAGRGHPARITGKVAGRQSLRSQIPNFKFKIQKTKCAPGVPEGRRAAHSIGPIEQFFS